MSRGRPEKRKMNYDSAKEEMLFNFNSGKNKPVLPDPELVGSKIDKALLTMFW